MTGESEAGRDRTRRRGMLLVGAAALAATAAGVYAMTHDDGETQTTESTLDARAQAVTVIEAQPRELQSRLTVSGEVRPRDDIRVYAPASGVRILKLLVDEGDMVKAGQPLAQLDQNLSRAQQLAAEASLKEAEVNAANAKAEYERAESVRDSGALSAEAIEARKAQADAAAARVAAARAQRNEVSARLQGGYVRAPAAGLVLDRKAELGAPVDGQLLFRIAGGNTLEVGVEVSEADMLALQKGQKATFRLIDGSQVTATLRRPPASIDSQTRTGEAIFDLGPDPKLKAGMFVRGETQLPARPQLAVPQTAVVFDTDGAFVFVVDQSSQARRTRVTIGERAGDIVAVTGGITPGQRIVAGGAAFLQDGDLIRPVGPGAEPAPATAADSKPRNAG